MRTEFICELCDKPLYQDGTHKDGGGCAPERRATARQLRISRPPLPYSVNDDEGKSWSSHLAGEEHALEHYDYAKELGIENPTITDRDGNDITQWVKAATS